MACLARLARLVLFRSDTLEKSCFGVDLAQKLRLIALFHHPQPGSCTKMKNAAEVAIASLTTKAKILACSMTSDWQRKAK